MSEFQLHVDDDENGILQDHTIKREGQNVDEELEVSDTIGYEFGGFYKDEKKGLSMSNKC